MKSLDVLQRIDNFKGLVSKAIDNGQIVDAYLHGGGYTIPSNDGLEHSKADGSYVLTVIISAPNPNTTNANPIN